jgi:hypothetical protein
MTLGVEFVTGNTEVQIQASINKVVADAGSGVVMLAPIPYLISNPILLPSKVTLQGAGKQSTILLAEADITVLDIKGTAGGVNGPGGIGGHVASPQVKDLAIQGNNAAWTTAPMVRMAYVHTAKFENVNFQFKNGIALYIQCEVWDSTWEECRWDNSGGTNTGKPMMLVQSADGTAFPGFGSSTDATNDLRFIHCTFEGFKDGAFWATGGQAGANPMGNFYFDLCKADQNQTCLGDWFRFEGMDGVALNNFDLSSFQAGPAYAGTPFTMFTFKACKDVTLKGLKHNQNSAQTDCMLHFDGTGLSGIGNRWVTIDDVEVVQIGSGSTSFATGLVRYTGTNLNYHFEFISYPRYITTSPLAIKPIFNLTAGTATYAKADGTLIPVHSKAGVFTVAGDIGTQEPGVPTGLAVFLGIDTTNNTANWLYPDGVTIKKAALT